MYVLTRNCIKAFFIFNFMNVNASLTNLILGKGDKYGEASLEWC